MSAFGYDGNTDSDNYSGDLRSHVSHELDISQKDVEEIYRLIRRIFARLDALSSGNNVRASAIQGVIPVANGGSGAVGNTLGAVSMWKNNSGATQVQGTVVIENGDRLFTTTTTVDDPLVIGVLDDASVLNTVDGRVRTVGYQSVVKTQGVVTAGHYLRASATAGRAEDAGTTRTSGSFAIALTASGGGAATVTAEVFPPSGIANDPSDASAIATVATTDATQTTLQTIAVPATTTMLITSRVVARRTGGAAGTVEDGAGYEITATVKNVAGTATLVGAVIVLTTQEDQVLWDATVDVNAGNARIRVTGAVLNNVDWKCATRTLSVS